MVRQAAVIVVQHAMQASTCICALFLFVLNGHCESHERKVAAGFAAVACPYHAQALRLAQAKGLVGTYPGDGPVGFLSPGVGKPGAAGYATWGPLTHSIPQATPDDHQQRNACVVSHVHSSHAPSRRLATFTQVRRSTIGASYGLQLCLDRCNGWAG